MPDYAWRILAFDTGGPFGYEITKDGAGKKIVTGLADFGTAFNACKNDIGTMMVADAATAKVCTGVVKAV